MIKVGDPAPDFTLPNTEGGSTTLSEFRGKKHVLLVWFPFAFSGRCTTEFCQLRDENADLVSSDEVEVIGISVDQVFALKAWKEQQGYPNSFVADFWPHGGVSEQFGTLNENGFTGRWTILIDKEGIVRYVGGTGTDVRDQGEWRKALAELS